jgi:hypothetical protein
MAGAGQKRGRVSGQGPVQDIRGLVEFFREAGTRPYHGVWCCQERPHHGLRIKSFGVVMVVMVAMMVMYFL